jgi:Domain of unknown function (DUF3859)
VFPDDGGEAKKVGCSFRRTEADELGFELPLQYLDQLEQYRCMRMMRRFVEIAVLFSSLGLLREAPVHAQAPSVDRIDIVEYGIYSVDRRVQGRDARGINQATAANVQHAATTKEIPARIGTTFGFRYKIVGKPDEAPITLRRIVVFPAPGLQPSSSSKPLARDEFAVQASVGETNYMFYTLEDAFELVPGIWAIEIWYGNRKLAAQSFTVSKADAGPPMTPSSSEGL